jgi:hypothetical protein
LVACSGPVRTTSLFYADALKETPLELALYGHAQVVKPFLARCAKEEDFVSAVKVADEDAFWRRSELAEHITEIEAWRQLKHALHWGRCELFLLNWLDLKKSFYLPATKPDPVIYCSFMLGQFA